MIDKFLIQQQDFPIERDTGFFDTIFALSNGHFGTRGSREEAAFSHELADEGTFINGFYESELITYGETAFGYAKEHQTIQRVPNGKMQTLIYRDQVLGRDGEILEEERKLDLKKATYERTFIWSAAGIKVRIETRRMASFADPHLLLIETKLTNLSQAAESFQFKTCLGPEKTEADQVSDDPRKAQTRGDLHYEKLSEHFPLLETQTNRSRLAVVVGKKTTVKDEATEKQLTFDEANQTYEETFSFSLKPEETKVCQSAIYYGDFAPVTAHQAVSPAEIEKQLNQALNRFDNGFEEQAAHMSRFWEASGIELTGDDQLAQGLNFNLFHLYQAAGRDGQTNIAAKGLTGDGYEGHFFWDTEMYMLPFFIYTQPEIARQLLKYRHTILPQARERARELSIEKGAWFAWRTINGHEASAYYPAGTAQVHINGDIAYATQLYYETTKDETFMKTYGLELLIETARFWTSFGFFDEQDAFHITGVTGPDEYTVLVNNNYYTNRMAKNNLEAAFQYADKYWQQDGYQALFDHLEVKEEELAEWKKAAVNMKLLYDPDLKLTLQDEAALERKPWDLTTIPKENFPLLLHYHPVIIYQHQVSKQADTVLAEYLFPDTVSIEQQRRDYLYYEKITTHDSSLSRSIFGIMASRLGFQEKAYPYFNSTALMDLTDLQGNTKDGIHAANLGGTWLSMVYGFAGMTVKEEDLHFEPHLPEQWEKLAFSIQYRQKRFKVTITQEDVTVEKINV